MTRTDDDARMCGTLISCDSCETGVVSRVVADSSPEGTQYEATDGSKFDPLERLWLCPQCSPALDHGDA